jgi:hypothetical protein
LHDFYEDSPEDAYLMQYNHLKDEAAVVLPMNRVDRLAG